MKQWKQVQEEMKLQTVWPYQQARGGWEGSKEHREKPGVKMAWMNSTNTQSNGLPICLFSYSPVVPPRLLQGTLQVTFISIWLCTEHAKWGPRTGAQHHHITHASCCCPTYRRSSFSPKLYKEAHLDTESSKVLKDKSLSYFISQRRWWG